MTDTEWMEIRERWRLECKDGNLDCADDMIPAVVSLRTGEPYAWVSRQYVEDMQKITDDLAFKASVAKIKKLEE
jgi:hypothetical protein